MRVRAAVLSLIAVACAFGAMPRAQQKVFTDVFPPAEFASRRAAVMAKIGDAVAILQGSAERPGEQAFRQGNQFFYLTGVEMPRALLVVDGRAREGRTIYTPLRPEVLGSASAPDVVALAAATATDPWDGRPSREAAFVQKLLSLNSRAEVRNLDPILDAMRSIKSEREIEVIRQATRIACQAIVAVMEEARPGMKEYELQAVADYVFRKQGAYGAAYFGLFATGANTIYSHYHKGTAVLQDGDWVQVDYGPDYKHYVSDVTRVFPANGRFTARQREFYSIYLQMYRALLASMRAGATASAIAADAVARMDAAIASFEFTDSKIKEAAVRFANGYRRANITSLGHAVGMEVHDVGPATPTLEAGQIFTIEPVMSIPDERVGMRLEDTLLVTKNGVENLSANLPIDIDAVEKICARPTPAKPARK